MKTQQELMLRLSLDAWYNHVMRTDKLLDALSDEQLQNEVAPGRNRGIYLMGHLAAVHDRIIALLDFGERLYPQLDDAFILNPDKTKTEIPSVTELRVALREVNTKLAKHFNELSTDDWFKKHTSVSEEDFAKEPHRNKLSILISRTNHLAYHFGQLAFLKK
jgi:hypothetical protein